MLLGNKIQSLEHCIKDNKGFVIGVSTLAATGFLDTFVTQINLKEISDEKNPFGRLILEQGGTAGLYYTKAAIAGTIIGTSRIINIIGTRLRYGNIGNIILYGASAYWGYAASTWY